MLQIDQLIVASDPLVTCRLQLWSERTTVQRLIGFSFNPITHHVHRPLYRSGHPRP